MEQGYIIGHQILIKEFILTSKTFAQQHQHFTKPLTKGCI